ncbi:trehalose-phosphatase [Ideonella sp. BN130291]|uniref:trehalose-phosphatase n=1 Tax=Ideonella sp. BN130291 TaxID=3112940 RepID=UPI002E260920|nr:trehalose-phosphatase [Ideonella sp. BN130291]
MPISPPLNDDHALFLDFDGTLVDIAPSPDRIVVDPALTHALARLSERLGGALAIISGRPIAELDRWLAPLTLPAAGIHGAERRRAAGTVERLPTTALDAIATRAEALAATHPGLRVERKGAAVALHYREAPQWEAACREAITQALAGAPGLQLLDGKMVLEVLPRGVSKGHAIEAFLAEPPFAGRQPLFLGDDVTDEAGFEVVQRLGGVAVKVGPGPTIAAQRIDGAAAVRRWLLAAAHPPKDITHHAASA